MEICWTHVMQYGTRKKGEGFWAEMYQYTVTRLGIEGTMGHSTWKKHWSISI